MKNRTRGFTLVEMLVVIAIIAILAGLSLAALSYARRTANERATTATILLLQQAIERYESDFHDFPSSEGDVTGILGAENLWRCLNTDKKEGPYLKSGDVRTCDSNRNGDPEPCDAWNRPIIYIHHRDYQNRNPQKRTFRLISAGIGGEFESGAPGTDDLCNWNKDKPNE
jgi:prepilin-type N-terminal cleavage/methylation domain-containing protein